MRVATGLLTTLLIIAAPLPLAAQSAPDGDLDIPADVTIMGKGDPSIRKATAIVNGEIITDTDVEQRLSLVVAANGGRIDPNERDRLRMQVLRNLIDEKLQIQEARSQKIEISDDEVNQTLDRVSQNFQRGPKEFAAFLKSSGSSEASLKQQIRGELAWSRLLRRRVEPFVNVGDDEVNAIIGRLKAAQGSEEYRVGEIFLSATTENHAEVMANAQRIADQIRKGASFIAYARQFSEASSAAVGGDLGWLRAEQLPEPLVATVTALKNGQLGGPMDVPGGVTLVALIDKRQVGSDPKQAVLNLKQLAISFPAGTTEAQAAPKVEAFNAATRRIGGCGNVEAVGTQLGANVIANDAVRLGELPEQLQDVVEKLQVGEATPPFGSMSDGVRVLVLCGRDEGSASAPSFDQVYAQLNEQRVSMRAHRYLRDLRRDAVIDYR